jgi:hypothetical protein
MPKTVFEIGERVGFLTIVGELPRVKSARNYLVKCDCGIEKAVVGYAMGREIRGTKSCGCWLRRRVTKANTKHGDARKGQMAAEYVCWRGMKQRCYDERVSQFKNYGGRGIRVCDRWRESYEAFLADMGPRPSRQHSIDRIDNDRGYSPDNCRWATRSEQRRNQRRSLAIPRVN